MQSHSLFRKCTETVGPRKKDVNLLWIFVFGKQIEAVVSSQNTEIYWFRLVLVLEQCFTRVYMSLVLKTFFSLLFFLQ